MLRSAGQALGHRQQRAASSGGGAPFVARGAPPRPVAAPLRSVSASSSSSRRQRRAGAAPARAAPSEDAGAKQQQQQQKGAAAADVADAAAGLNLPFESDIRTYTGGTVGGGPSSSSSGSPSSGSGSASPGGLSPAPLAPGTVVHDRYVIEAVLGSGANATTYRATDRGAGGDGRTPVALKALSLRGLRDWKQLELFQREAVVLKGLNHPGIPRYVDYFEEDAAADRCFFIVQELVDGRTLGSMVAAGMRAPDEDEVLRIAAELLATLKYLGGLRPPVIHRDIKPDNVVLEGGAWGGRVRLVDFGGVQGAAGAGGESGLGSTIVGTYGYMAPEQFTGQATTASDLYALGGTLLYLVSGLVPGAFPQARMRIDWRARVSVGMRLGELLDGLLEPLAEDRLTPQEAIDVATGRAARRRTRQRQEEQLQLQQQQNQQNQQGAGALAGGRGYSRSRVPTGPVRKPAGSRVQLSSTNGRLDVEIPPEGLSGNSIGTGLFALAWNAFVAFWTFSALASGGILFALFSAPFWFAGFQLAGQAFGGALTRERFAIGRSRWRLEQELAVLKGGAARFLGAGRGGAAKQLEGDAADLTGARVVTTVVVNGVPQTAVEVVEGVRKFRFGESLDPAEQEWLAYEINRRVAELRGRDVRESDMPEASDPEEVFDDGADPSMGPISDIDPWWDATRNPGGRAGRGADPFGDRDDLFNKRR